MNQSQFSRRVDELLVDGMDLAQAISAAGNEESHHHDPFDVMREAALGEGL